MSIRYLSFALVVAALSGSNMCYAAGEDVAGSADHPLVGRYDGSVIIDYAVAEYDETALYDGPSKDDTFSLEGRITEIYYRVPNERSTLEVMRNYEQQLASEGFETVYSCSKFDCGTDRAGAIYFASWVMGDKRGQFVGDFYNEQRYLVARRRSSEGDVHVSIYDFRDVDYSGHLLYVKVVESTPMEEDQIFVNADEMDSAIAETGRVSLYGIYFDTDEATIRPESRPTLVEVAALLEKRPQLEIVVVGHTDNTGTMQYNMDLSGRRANAVVNALVREFGVDPGRLDAWGAGQLAPVATNKTDEGRAKNRRVDLVEQ